MMRMARYGSALLVVASIAIGGAACSRQSLESLIPASAPAEAPKPQDAVQPVAQKPAGVKGMLMDGKWTPTSGISQGLIWQFAGDGTVSLQEGGSVDQSYRWELLETNEADRQLTIKYWTVKDPPNDFREWKWKFDASGSSAVVENMRRRNGQYEFKGEMNMQKTP
jgi:hypothetical protein